jgi:CheY-like chemotaxis protein
MKKKILVIDDDATIRFLLDKILDEKYEVETKSDGFEALDWLNAGNIPDLIIVDMEMPNINGKVLLRRIKFSPKFRYVPIIVISATDNNTVKNNFIQLGASDFIIKPFMDVDLLERIDSALNDAKIH